jgi:hypothetical protein
MFPIQFRQGPQAKISVMEIDWLGPVANRGNRDFRSGFGTTYQYTSIRAFECCRIVLPSFRVSKAPPTGRLRPSGEPRNQELPPVRTIRPAPLGPAALADRLSWRQSLRLPRW